MTSQIRRDSLSIISNYVKDYNRKKNKIYKNFLEIFYGSLKETKYFLHFSLTKNYLSENNYEKAIKLTEDIETML